ncbi:MAG: hypothetical protein SGPRY_013402 [Prymnesium sp.]
MQRTCNPSEAPLACADTHPPRDDALVCSRSTESPTLASQKGGSGDGLESLVSSLPRRDEAKAGRKRASHARAQGAPSAKRQAEAPPQINRGGPGGIRKREACKFFLEGRCKEGENCGFLHQGEPTRRSEACKFFVAGQCAKGSECLFSHDLKSVPCRRYHLDGRCREGEDCRFSHAQLSDSERIRFKQSLEERRGMFESSAAAGSSDALSESRTSERCVFDSNLSTPRGYNLFAATPFVNPKSRDVRMPSVDGTFATPPYCNADHPAQAVACDWSGPPSMSEGSGWAPTAFLD